MGFPGDLRHFEWPSSAKATVKQQRERDLGMTYEWNECLTLDEEILLSIWFLRDSFGTEKEKNISQIVFYAVTQHP